MNNSRTTLIVGLLFAVLVGLVIFAGAGNYSHYLETSQVHQAIVDTPDSTSNRSPYAKYMLIRSADQSASLAEITLSQITADDSQPSEPFNLAGWVLKSRDGTFLYTIPALIYTSVAGNKMNAKTNSVSEPVTIYPFGGESVIIRLGGNVEKNYVRESEGVFYILYTGGSTATLPTNTTLDLFDVEGRLVSSLTY